MAPSLSYDMTLVWKFDTALGKAYTAIAVSWSFILLCGGLFLIYNRNLPFLRIRKVALTVSAVATLHVYWLLCLLAYGLNGYFPCGTEFWIMNIYLPFGIALFHASNSQLLYIAGLQRKFASTESLVGPKEKSQENCRGWRRHLEKVKARKAVEKIVFYIAIGMAAQFLVAIIIYFLSRKFHAYGVFGEPHQNGPQGKMNCRRGAEWLPSVLWQFFWSWIYAPYLLWKVREIRDVHSWRLQTVCCCIAGLPASPMWLVALYLPQMRVVNQYFIPPMWFSPSIFLMELFMIFVPCWQILRYRKLKNETIQILNEWEQKKSGTSLGSDTTKAETFSGNSLNLSRISSTSTRQAQSHMYTMVALEKALQTNPTPLLLFAALKDFSGENISFLNHVQEWKNSWRNSQRSSALKIGSVLQSSADKLRRQQFKKAIEIYSSFVSLKYSDFPINISSGHLKELQAVFEETSALVNADPETGNAATPFDDIRPNDDVESAVGKDGISIVSTAVGTSEYFDDLMPGLGVGRGSVINSYQMKSIGDKLPAYLKIPDNFGPNVFDNSVDSIKYIVLTNTWPKFVNAGYANKMEKTTIIGKLKESVAGYRNGWSKLLP